MDALARDCESVTTLTANVHLYASHLFRPLDVDSAFHALCIFRHHFPPFPLPDCRWMLIALPFTRFITHKSIHTMLTWPTSVVECTVSNANERYEPQTIAPIQRIYIIGIFEILNSSILRSCARRILS